MKIGYVGLGKMGLNMVLRLVENGVEVVAWNRSQERIENLKFKIENSPYEKNFTGSNNIQELINKLLPPRIIWLMLPAGDVVDEYIDQIAPQLDKGDLIIDGGNSFYKDALRRSEKLEKSGIHFMDIGVSGGPGGARSGASLMIGGQDEDFKRIEPVAKAAAAPQSYAHLGPVGAGHFAKMVHNGIEYGMMQAIAEGAAILKKSQFKYDLAQVFELYNHRTVIESRLVGWTQEALVEDPQLAQISSKIDHTGEGEWTIKTAKELDVEVPVIEKSFQVRVDSTAESENFGDKTVSAMRGKFGQHDVKKK